MLSVSCAPFSVASSLFCPTLEPASDLVFFHRVLLFQVLVRISCSDSLSVQGHTDKVEALAVSPVNDCFLSGSADGTVRLWDMRVNICQGVIHRKGRAAVAYDPQGLIFAVSSGTNQIKLFDSRSFDRGAFATFEVTYDVPFEFGSLKFSNDGHQLLLSTSCDAVFVLDAFEGDMKQIFTQRKNPRRAFFEASWTPDSRFVLSGGEDGAVHCWSAEAGTEVAVLRGHAGPVRCVPPWPPPARTSASGSPTRERGRTRRPFSV